MSKKSLSYTNLANTFAGTVDSEFGNVFFAFLDSEFRFLGNGHTHLVRSALPLNCLFTPSMCAIKVFLLFAWKFKYPSQYLQLCMCIALTLCFTGELEVDAFCLTVSGLQRLMAGERVLMVGIIPHSFQKRMFEMITRSGRFLCPGILYCL